MKIFVTIPGRPYPQKRPRFGQGRAYDPKENKAYKKFAGTYLKIAMDGIEPFKGPVRMHFHADFGSEGEANVSVSFESMGEPFHSTPHHIARPDLDNLIKAIADAAEGIVYANDSQICELKATKFK